MSDDRGTGINIKYWKCQRCGATFTTEQAARQHTTCPAGGTASDVVVVTDQAASTSVNTKK